MLVKAEFVQELGEDTVDFLFLFNLSEDDLSLMGIDGARHWDKKHTRHKISPNLTGELHDAVLDVHRRGFVIKLPFKPDTYENMEPFPGQLRKLRAGDPYWIMLKGPWKREEVYQNKIGKQRLSHPIFEAAGIYPYVKDLQGFFDFAEQLDELPQSFYQETEMVSLDAEFRKIFSDAQDERASVEWWFRLWGLATNPCLTREFLKTGEQKYGKNNAVDFKGYYRMFAQTTEERKSPLRPVGSPLFNLITELSSPEEFGALGVLLPFAVILNPYAFVGPCSSPGLTSSGGSNATQKLLPFWIVDLFARTGYRFNYRYKDRAAGIIYEAMRHLEQRNYQAFTTYNSTKPNWSESFNFDKDGIAPNGSTIFSRSVIQAAVLRRNKELEFTRKGALRKVYIADGHYPNPYKALAGFLGKALDMVNINDALGEGIQKISKSSAKITTEDKQQAYQWRGLRHRVNTIEDLSNLILDQSLNFDTNQMLRVAPPITEEAGANSNQKCCTPSQAGASRMTIRWPFSCVTGNPGTGKSFFLHELVRFVHEISQTGADTYLLLLTPTNIASSRICRLFPNEELYMFGRQQEDPEDEQEEESPRRSFRIAVGTIDSFLGKIKTSPKLREELRQRQGVLGIDESSMVTAEKFKEVLDFFRDADTNALSDRLLRGILVGDPYQLLSVEPGNFYADMLKFLPTTQLKEQMRYGRDPDDDFEISLEDLFDGVRAGMTNENDRAEVVKKLVDIAGNPDLSGGHIGVYLIDDTPTGQPPLENNERWWAKFVHDLEKQVRDIVLSEVLDWNHSPLSGGSLTPRIPLRPSREEQRLAASDYQKFHGAFTQTDLPFKIISCVRKPRSESGLTEYVSSSLRVNGWIHDILRGRTVQDLGFKGYYPRNAAPMIPIGSENIWYPKFGDDWMPYDTAMKQCQDKRARLREFLSRYRPNNLVLSPGWPYTVLKQDFKKYGVFRGDTLRFIGATPRRNRNYYRFVTTDGTDRELVVSARYCTPHHLSFGWASNVHQVQGSEYPLVIVLWLDGICYPFLNQNWQHVVTKSADEITTPLKPFRFGGVTMGNELASLDDRLDSRAFYTAITRTSMQKLDGEQRLVGIDGNSSANKVGRCVIVAGKHALRRYLSLQVHDRCSPLYGMVWDKLQMTEKETRKNASA